MQELPNAVRRLRANFVFSEAQIFDIAKSFQGAMVAGLEGKESSLKMLPTFLTKPTGQEKGVYLAVDFGGTNVRIMTVELKGHGKFEILGRRAFPLKDKDYDFTSREASGTDLFEFIAEQMKYLLMPGLVYPLGFTFSFPSRQTGVSKAILINWTKEIKTSGVEGHDVSDILKKALKHRNMRQVIPRAIINDTVGTLLTSAYSDPFADMGSICGTGHNTCYLEYHSPGTGGQTIINMESGNFDVLPDTLYDDLLDRQSEMPGKQRLEKMVSGQYIGELTRIIIQDFINSNLIFKDSRPDIFFTPYAIKAEDISELLADESPGLMAISEWLKNYCGIPGSLKEERITLRTIASIVITRSIQLTAATYIGVLQHIDPQLEKRHTIAIDGSLYEKTPGYANKLKITLNNLLKEKSDLVSIKLTKSGSGVGAAIAAALVDESKES